MCRHIYYWNIVDCDVQVLVEWTQFGNMSLSLIYLIVMQNFATIRSAVFQKMTFEVTILVIFRIFLNWNCRFRRSVWAAGCDVVKLYVLQSYRSCTFCKRITRGETQFWIELAPYTHGNHNDINSDDLPFIISIIPVTCDGSNLLWCQGLLLPAMFPMMS